MTTSTFTLSEREAEAIDLRQQGLKIREIAARLGIAFETARIHVRHAEEKSELASVEEIAQASASEAKACVCGSVSQPCRRCYGKKCSQCHAPIYRDESYSPIGGGKLIHMRLCKSQLRPDYMPNPAAHDSLPAPDPREA